ncbi:MAG: hypothetical protein CSYNP_03076 [Syntrophus sp. SKADARSKE-3]|nr:hypothetical protein [Syntrophus sp. SKADARSKE-3]
MKTDLYYYTGTGNSLWAARTLAGKLGETEIIPMTRPIDSVSGTHSDATGFIFPVHIWGLPRRVIEFVHSLTVDSSKYYFALAVNAGQVAATLIQLQKLMHARGLLLSAGFDIVMPSNYLPWGGPGPVEKRMARIGEARKKIGHIADIVLKKQKKAMERGPLWQNVIFSVIYSLSFDHVPKMDKSFWTDEKCNSCNVCVKVCPCNNIQMVGGKPSWLNHCEQCLACIQWCPQEALPFGKRTSRFDRYHHPEVNLHDLISPGLKKPNI